MVSVISTIQVIIPVLALCISILTYVLMNGKASEELVSNTERNLREEIAVLRKDIAECRTERDACERERILLMERLLKR